MGMNEAVRLGLFGQSNNKRSGILASQQGEKRLWKNGVVPYTLNPNLRK